MHDGDGKALRLFLYPKKYLNESLLYGFLWDNIISSKSTSLILWVFLIFMKNLFNNTIFSKIHSFLFHSLFNEKKKGQLFLFLFFILTVIFFDIVLVFDFFLQTYYDICFFRILSFFSFFR